MSLRGKISTCEHIHFNHHLKQEYLDNWRVFRKSWDVLHERFTLKKHFAAHLGARAKFLGAPSVYGCWADEGWNRVVKNAAPGAHRGVFYKRVLNDMRRLAGSWQYPG